MRARFAAAGQGQRVAVNPTAPRTHAAELAIGALAVLALLIAALVGGLASPQLWTLVAVLGAGYLLNRGLTRSAPPRIATRTVRHFGTEPAHERVHRASAPPPREPAPAAEVTLSEEQLHIDHRTRPRERVRLVKHVVTEEVTVRVP